MAEEKWIGKAVDKMKAKGTVGKFGKATPAKIAAGKRAGGERKKEAVFAENMKGTAKKHKEKDGPKKIGMRSRFSAKHHDPIGDHEGGMYKGK